MQEDARQPYRSRRDRPPPKRAAKWIVLGAGLALALLIVKREVPQVNDWIEGTLRPHAWAAVKTCQRTALAASRHPDFARIIESGAVNTTQNGYVVQRVQVGEQGKDGAEQKFFFSCYVDAAGEVVSTRLELQRENPPRAESSR